MLNDQELSAAIGTTAYGPNGDKIGTVEHFFLDDRSGAPSWVAVSTGLFGTRHSVAPALEASFADGALRLPVSAEAVKSAPALGNEQHLDPGEEAQLRQHYGLATAADAGTADGTPAGWTDVPPPPYGAAPPAGQPSGDATIAMPAVDPSHTAAPAAAHTAAPPAAPATDGAMTRSEEQLRVGTERVAATRVRLVKYVVTEEVQITVPVRREEIRVEEVPVDAADEGPGESLLPAQEQPVGAGAQQAGAGGGAAGTGGLPREIILHTERPIVTMEVVPTERVRLGTELVHGQEQITEQVQREQIVVDEDTVRRPEQLGR